MGVSRSDKQLEKLNRRRVKKACDSCRLKKTKCDGRKPCSKCSVENKICVFSNKLQVKERNHQRGYVELLETKVELLKKSLEKIITISSNFAPFLNDFVTPSSTVEVNKVIEFLIKNEGLLDCVSGNVSEKMVNQESTEIANIILRLQKNFDANNNEEEHVYDTEHDQEQNSQKEEDQDEDGLEQVHMDTNESNSDRTPRDDQPLSLRDFSSEDLPHVEGDFSDNLMPDSLTNANFRLRDPKMAASADYMHSQPGEFTDKEELSPDALLPSEGSRLVPHTLLPHTRSELPKSLFRNGDSANITLAGNNEDIWGYTRKQINNEPYNLDYETFGASNAYEQLPGFSSNFDFSTSPIFSTSDKEALDLMDVSARFFEITP